MKNEFRKVELSAELQNIIESDDIIQTIADSKMDTDGFIYASIVLGMMMFFLGGMSLKALIGNELFHMYAGLFIALCTIPTFVGILATIHVNGKIKKASERIFADPEYYAFYNDADVNAITVTANPMIDNGHDDWPPRRSQSKSTDITSLFAFSRIACFYGSNFYHARYHDMGVQIAGCLISAGVQAIHLNATSEKSPVYVEIIE